MLTCVCVCMCVCIYKIGVTAKEIETVRVHAKRLVLFRERILFSMSRLQMILFSMARP